MHLPCPVHAGTVAHYLKENLHPSFLFYISKTPLYVPLMFPHGASPLKGRREQEDSVYLRATESKKRWGMQSCQLEEDTCTARPVRPHAQMQWASNYESNFQSMRRAIWSEAIDFTLQHLVLRNILWPEWLTMLSSTVACIQNLTCEWQCHCVWQCTNCILTVYM